MEAGRRAEAIVFERYAGRTLRDCARSVLRLSVCYRFPRPFAKQVLDRSAIHDLGASLFS